MPFAAPLDLAALLRRGAPEGVRLEYKAAYNEATASEAIRTVCAFANDFANVNGGYVVFGVDARDGAPCVPPAGIDATEVEAVQKRFRGLCRRIHPAYQPVLHAVPFEDRWLLLVQCPAGDQGPYEAPESIGRHATKRRYIRANAETIAVGPEHERRLFERFQRVPFDDRPCHEARMEDVAPELFWQHVRDAGLRVEERRDHLRGALRDFRLTSGSNGDEVPRNVALMFFNEAPRRWFPGARVEVAQLPGGREGDTIIEQVFEGPLSSMLRASLNYLRSILPVRTVKLPDRAETGRVEAFPFAAVEEAVVNAVHHRGYEREFPDPVQVEILPQLLRVVSFPGPDPTVSLSALESGELGTLRARNRRIAEFLKEARLAEARGTGLPRIRRSMADNGSPPPVFRFDEARTRFEVLLPVHPSFRPVVRQPRRPRPGRPVPAEELIGREGLCAQVLRAAELGPVALVGPRGRGRSSLLAGLNPPPRGPVLRLDLEGLDFRGVTAALGEWMGRAGLSPSGPSASGLPEEGALLPPPGTWVLLDNADPDHEEWGDANALDRWLRRLAAPESGLRLVLVLAHPLAEWSADQGPGAPSLRHLLVPPLDRAATLELSLALLEPLSGTGPDPRAAEIVRLSAGLPGIVHLLAAEAALHHLRGAEELSRRFDDLLVEPSDPTGLRARLRAFQGRLGRSGGYARGPSPVERALLGIVAAREEGVPHLELVARSVSEGWPRLAVLELIRSLQLDGSLVEVDGVVRFEHPLMREELLRPADPPAAEDDVPF